MSLYNPGSAEGGRGMAPALPVRARDAKLRGAMLSLRLARARPRGRERTPLEGLFGGCAGGYSEGMQS